MLNSLLQMAVKARQGYEGDPQTTAPLVQSEMRITPEQYEELVKASQAWWKLAEDGGNDYPKVGGVVVYNPDKRHHMVFVGNYQITVVTNETTMRRSEAEGVIQYDPHTFAKVTVIDYSLHPERLAEYYLNPESWSIVQYTTGVGIAYLVALYKKLGQPQPKYAPAKPETTSDERVLAKL